MDPQHRYTWQYRPQRSDARVASLVGRSGELQGVLEELARITYSSIGLLYCCWACMRAAGGFNGGSEELRRLLLSIAKTRAVALLRIWGTR